MGWGFGDEGWVGDLGFGGKGGKEEWEYKQGT